MNCSEKHWKQRYKNLLFLALKHLTVTSNNSSDIENVMTEYTVDLKKSYQLCYRYYFGNCKIICVLMKENSLRIVWLTLSQAI